jgi:tetratricopeptide (TPR) repeat protein
MLDGRARTWLEYFAMPATHAAEAKKALDVLASYPAILNRGERWFWHDGAIGRVYMLVGRYAEALPFFKRAVSSCAALEDLVQYVHVLMDYGALLEKTGDRAGACAAYNKVLKSWPLRSGSESAQLAERRRRVTCAGVTSGGEPSKRRFDHE